MPETENEDDEGAGPSDLSRMMHRVSTAQSRIARKDLRHKGVNPRPITSTGKVGTQVKPEPNFNPMFPLVGARRVTVDEQHQPPPTPYERTVYPWKWIEEEPGRSFFVPRSTTQKMSAATWQRSQRTQHQYQSRFIPKDDETNPTKGSDDPTYGIRVWHKTDCRKCFPVEDETA